MPHELKSPSRRQFIDGLLCSSLIALFGGFVYAVLRYITPPRIAEPLPENVEAARTDDPELAQKGFKIVRYGRDPVILIRVAGDDYRAFSATCTHLGCVVEYRGPGQQIVCNCHGGTYDLAGRNTGGPPPGPLRHYTVRVLPADPQGVGRIVVART